MAKGENEMKTLSAWQAHTESVSEWLEALLASGAIDEGDTVWSAPDGSFGVGEPTPEQEEDADIMEMVDVGSVGEWLANA